MDNGLIDFWSLHGWWFLFFIAFFPRLTMLFTGICFAISGPLFWVGWVLAPHLTVAIIATTLYWDTNPVLCVFAWIVALGGTSSEGNATKVGYKRYRDY